MDWVLGGGRTGSQGISNLVFFCLGSWVGKNRNQIGISYVTICLPRWR